MSDEWAETRLEEFRARPFHWFVVHHLLSADLVRELASAIVDQASDGKLALCQLFEEVPPAGPTAASSWFVATRKANTPFADHLSRLLLTTIWRGDDPPFPPQQGINADEAAWISALNGAFILSSADLRTAQRTVEAGSRLEPLGPLLRALAAASDAATAGPGSVLPEAVEHAGSGLPPILGALLTKHVGDLCGDVDRWDMALDCYERAQTLADLAAEPAWREASAATRQILAQSTAMATWYFKGAESAATMLDELVSGAELGTAPLAFLNGAFDLLNARVANGSFPSGWTDRRAAVFASPLLVQSNHMDNALTYSSAGRFREAHRWFWATLRRQTALGGTATSKVTKGHYGRSIIEELEATFDRHRRPEEFALGMRLLVESGQIEIAEKTAWSDRLVGAHVDEGTLVHLRNVVAHMPGARLERTMVATVLRRDWLRKLPRERHDIARELLGELASTARHGIHSGMGNINDGGLALKSLRQVGTERPEFNGLVGNALVELVEAMIRGSGPLTVSEAIETAAAFIDGVDAEQAQALCLLTMGLVEGLPRDAAWPVTRAASAILGADAAVRLAKSDAEFGRRRAVALVRLALNSQAEHTSLLYLLREIDPSVVEEQVDADGLMAIVADIRERAGESASSGATGNIHALLAAPRVSGEEGVEAALEGLDKIVRSATSNRPSPSLQNGYEAFLLLARRGDGIAADLGTPTEEFRSRLRGLLAPLGAMWRTAAARPLIFAGFSIPPQTVPNRVTVHNWTFATLEFARWLNAASEVEEPLAAASANEMLAGPMSVARAVQARATADLVPGTIAAERADAFYAALGERLIATAAQPPADAAANLRILLDRCMKVGPRGEDAALLLTAHRMGMRVAPDASHVAVYTAKVRQDPKLRLSLSPLLQAVLQEQAS